MGKKKRKSLSVKDRLTIRMKATRPMPWFFYLALCVVMLGIMIYSAKTDKISTVSAPAALKSESISLRLTMAGDVLVDDAIREQATANSYSSLFKGVKKYWSDSDYVFVNIDGAILEYDVANYTSKLDIDEEAVYLRPRALRGKLDVGINLVGFTSEDTYNYGRTGVESTLRVLESYDASYLGIVNNTLEPIYVELPYTLTAEDGTEETHSVAVFSVNDIIAQYSSANESRAGLINSTLDSLYETVYEASQTCDYVVVYVHFGDEDSATVTDEQTQIAHALINAGAMLVVGSHSHMVQTMESYGGGLIVYGLGDLVANSAYSENGDSVLLDFVVDENNAVQIYLTPLHSQGGRPVITESKLYRNRIISALTESVSSSVYTVTDDGQILVELEAVPKTVTIDVVESEKDDTSEDVLAGEEEEPEDQTDASEEEETVVAAD